MFSFLRQNSIHMSEACWGTIIQIPINPPPMKAAFELRGRPFRLEKPNSSTVSTHILAGRMTGFTGGCCQLWQEAGPQQWGLAFGTLIIQLVWHKSTRANWSTPHRTSLLEAGGSRGIYYTHTICHNSREITKVFWSYGSYQIAGWKKLTA